MPQDAAAPPASPSAGTRAAGPRLTLLSQYLKDLSFENLQPPATFERGHRPKGEVSLDVNLATLEDGTYEVSLRMRIGATIDAQPAYVVEADYCGRFAVADVSDKKATRRLLMVRAPAMLFPFARAVVFGATREGGFPPLNVNPVDFSAIYRRRKRRGASPPAADA